MGKSDAAVARREAFRKQRESGAGDGISRVGVSLIVPLDRLVENELNERKTFVETELKELGDSINEHGLLDPIRVFEEGQGNDRKYVIHGGHRRYRAIKEYTKLDKVRVIIAERGDDTKVVVESITQNNFQVPPNPVETAEALQAILDDPESGISNQVQLAKVLGKSRDWVKDRMALQNLSEEDKARVRDSDLGQSSARVLRDISRLDDPEEQSSLVNELVSGASGRSVTQKISEKKNPEKKDSKPNPKLVAFKDDSVSVIIQSRTGKKLTKDEQKDALEKALKRLS